MSQYHPAVLSFSYFKGILTFQQCDSWEPEPQLRLPSVYPFINSSQSWDPAMLRSGEDGIVSSLAETGQVQAGTSHTERCLSRHSKRAVCLLPELPYTLIMHIKTLGGTIIFKCNFIAERPVCCCFFTDV